MSESAAVLFVNQAFYAAFRDRDLETMEALWAHEAPVACVHPGWQALAGREAVMESWDDILTNPSAPEIHCHDAEAFMLGDTALVICYEVIDEAVLVASNLFVREAGSWRLVHHQAGPCNAPPGFAEDEEEDDEAPSSLQ
jgi:ketosteroid isomerase-like protein